MLARALAGDQVDREQLAAAKSLFSYRPGIPAPGEQTGGKPFNLADVVRTAVEVWLVRADGGRVVVEGAAVEYIDPRTPREEIAHSASQGFPPVPATLKSPEADLAELVGEAPPESAAKLARRYGSDPDVLSWPQP